MIKKIGTFLKKISDSLEGFFSGVFEKHTAGWSDKRRRAFIRWLLAAELFAILLCFLFSKNRWSLAKNVFYASAPGGVVELVMAPIAYGIDRIKESFPEGHQLWVLKEVYLGNSVHWLTVGVQTMLLSGYLKMAAAYEKKRILVVLHAALFTFLLGAIVEFLLSRLFVGTAGLNVFLREVPVIGTVWRAIRIAAAAVLLVFAVVNLAGNVKMYIKMIPLAALIGIGSFIGLMLPILILTATHTATFLYDEPSDLIMRLLDLGNKNMLQLVYAFTAFGFAAAYVVVMAREKAAKGKHKNEGSLSAG